MKKSSLKIQFNSPVVLWFALISLAVLILGELTGGETTYRYFCTYSSSWGDPLTYVRLFGHVLGHGGLDHYINNMMFILLLGPILEEKYGSGNLLIMILITAAVEGLIIDLFFYGTAVLGASGIVFMFIILSSFVSASDGSIPVTFILIAVLYIGREVYNGVFIRDQISQLGHVIGGVCGAVFGFKFSRR